MLKGPPSTAKGKKRSCPRKQSAKGVLLRLLLLSNLSVALRSKSDLLGSSRVVL